MDKKRSQLKLKMTKTISQKQQNKNRIGINIAMFKENCKVK